MKMSSDKAASQLRITSEWVRRRRRMAVAKYSMVSTLCRAGSTCAAPRQGSSAETLFSVFQLLS
jgi:hypothetical protein